MTGTLRLLNTSIFGPTIKLHRPFCSGRNSSAIRPYCGPRFPYSSASEPWAQLGGSKMNDY